MRNAFKAAALSASALAASACITAGAQSLEGVSAATYELEKSHAFLTAKISHNGLSDYNIDFTDFNATLEFDPADPTAAVLTATVNPLAIATHLPDAEEREKWETRLTTGDQFFNGDEFPEVKFVSSSIEKTGEFTGTVSGDLTFLGVTKPVSFDVAYNGTGNAPWFGPRDLIGFNAEATITRSEFGMSAYTPNIGDDVKIIFSGEFLEAAAE